MNESLFYKILNACFACLIFLVGLAFGDFSIRVNLNEEYLVYKDHECWVSTTSDVSYSYGMIHLGTQVSIDSSGWTVLKTLPGDSVYALMYEKTDLEPWMCEEF